jgi:hypothetical protein
MVTYHSFLKRITHFSIILMLGLSLYGCSGMKSWKEEVKLLDGRVINITQLRRYDNASAGSNSGAAPREFWLTFKLPELGDQEVMWHENLLAQVFNVYQGKLYVVGIPFTEREFRQYGSPQPSYVGYRFEMGKWQRIPFNEIPIQIYDANLLILNEPPNGAKFVNFTMKDESNRDKSLPSMLKRIDPKFEPLHY